MVDGPWSIAYFELGNVDMSSSVMSGRTNPTTMIVGVRIVRY
jgi:hypothetical protein